MPAEVQQWSAMVGGGPSSNVSAAFFALSLQSACPATLYTASQQVGHCAVRRKMVVGLGGCQMSWAMFPECNIPRYGICSSKFRVGMLQLICRTV
jgi:hypothetical protein